MKINPLVIQLVSALTFFIASSALATCMSGDCENGFGTLKVESGATITTIFDNRRPTGYYVMDMRSSGTNSVCEGVSVRGQFTGPRRCQYGDFPFFDQFLDGNRGVLILKAGIIHEEGIFKDMKLTFETTVDVDNIFESLRRARSRADYRVVDSLPEELWFLPTGRDSLLSEYVAKYYPKKEKALPTLSDDPAPIASAIGENSPYCVEGDCDNGFGVLDKLNNKVVARFLNSQAFGYGLWFNPNGSVCETYFIKGVATGVQRCTIEAKGVLDGIAYIELVDGKKSHSFLSDSEGKILTRLVLKDGKIKEEDIDPRKMWQQAKRNRDSASDFVLAELPERLKPFPEVWFPSERAKASKPSKPKVASTPPKPKSAPKPKPAKKAKVAKAAPPARCVEGNCVNGFGTLKVGGSEFIGKFTDGKLFGYGLVMTDEVYCEAYLINTKFDGLAHCFLPATNHHVFRKMKGKINNGPQIIISSAGDITSFDMYVDGEKIDGYFGSTSNKRRRQSMELRNFQTGLSNLRRGAPEQIADWVPSQLRTIPSLEVADFKSMPPLNRERMTREVDPSNPNVIKTLPAPASRSSNRNGGVLSGANYETTELGQLALIASELNGNRRQVNPNYRLERVRIEPNEFELHFEFITPRDVSGLNKSLLRSSNRTAYCKSSKLEPFRTQNMPARYRFTDPNNEEINFLIKASEC